MRRRNLRNAAASSVSPVSRRWRRDRPRSRFLLAISGPTRRSVAGVSLTGRWKRASRCGPGACLSSSATRDPASSTRAPPKTAFDAELSSQAKSLCAARARSWMQESDTPVCPGLLVEHARHPPLGPGQMAAGNRSAQSVIFPPSPAATLHTKSARVNHHMFLLSTWGLGR